MGCCGLAVAYYDMVVAKRTKYSLAKPEEDDFSSKGLCKLAMLRGDGRWAQMHGKGLLENIFKYVYIL